jgi:pseudouridine synthase
MTLTEGRNRQIRNMCDAVGLTVKELRRVSIGPIHLKGLRSGDFRPLTPKELRVLLKITSDDKAVVDE